MKRSVTQSGWPGAGPMLLALLPLLPAATLAQDNGAPLSQLLSINNSVSSDLFKGRRFYPGEAVIFSVSGVVTPFRRTDYVERCTKRITVWGGGWCVEKKNFLEIIEDVSGGPDLIPVLVEVRDNSGAIPGVESVSPGPAVQPTFATGEKAATPYVVANTAQIRIRFPLPAVRTSTTLARSFSLRGVVADNYTSGPRVLNRCGDPGPSTCGIGDFTVGVAGVESDERFGSIIALLKGPDPISAAAIDSLVDVWLYSAVSADRVAPDKTRAEKLSAAVFDHAMKNHAAAGFGRDRQALLEKAIVLNPDNTQAATKLVANLIENGDLVRARTKLQSDLPKLRDAYQDERTKDTVSAGVYIDYAEQLLNAGSLSILERAKVDGMDIRTSVSLVDESLRVLDELRSKKVAFGTRSPGEALRLYLLASETVAMAGQLLRDEDSLDAAIKKLENAIRLLPDERPGYMVSVSADPPGFVLAQSQLVFKGASSPEVSVQIELLNRAFSSMMASSPDGIVGINALSRQLSQIQGFNAGRPIDIVLPSQGQISAVDSAGSVLLVRVAGKKGEDAVHVLVHRGKVLDLPRNVRMPRLIDGGFASLVTGKGLVVVRNGMPDASYATAKLFDDEKVTGLSADVAGQWFVFVVGGDSPKLVVLNAADQIAEDKRWAIHTLSDIPSAYAVAVRQSQTHALVLLDRHVCIVKFGESRAPLCFPHNIPRASSRLVQPGIVPGTNGIFAWGVKAINKESSAAVYLLDAESALAAKPDVAVLAMREVRLPVDTDWSATYLHAPTAGPASAPGSWRIRLSVPTIAATLAFVDGKSGELAGSARSEARFSGIGAMFPGGVLGVQDRQGRWRQAGLSTSIGPPNTEPVWIGQTGSVWIAAAEQPTDVVHFIAAGGAAQQIRLSTNGAKYRLLPVRSRDHSPSSDLLVFLPVEIGAATSLPAPLLFDPRSRATTALQVAPGDAKDIRAVIPEGAAVLVLSEQQDGVRASVGTESVRLMDPTSEGGVLEVIASERLVFVRQISATGEGKLVAFSPKQLPKTAAAVWAVQFKAMRLGRGALEGGLPQRGIGRAVPGFVDSIAGIGVFPGDSCNFVYLESGIWPSAEERKLLPESAPLGVHVAAFPPRVYVASEGVVSTIQSSSRTTLPGRIPSKCQNQTFLAGDEK